MKFLNPKEETAATLSQARQACGSLPSYPVPDEVLAVSLSLLDIRQCVKEVMKQFEDGKEHKLSCDATLADWLWHNMTSYELIAIYSIPGKLRRDGQLPQGQEENDAAKESARSRTCGQVRLVRLGKSLRTAVPHKSHSGTSGQQYSNNNNNNTKKENGKYKHACLHVLPFF